MSNLDIEIDRLTVELEQERSMRYTVYKFHTHYVPQVNRQTDRHMHACLPAFLHVSVCIPIYLPTYLPTYLKNIFTTLL